jgi:undecaprenyl diphosphate synthase
MFEQLRRRAAAAEEKPAACAEARTARHVAIIMDGNGRWATSRGLPRVAGHRAGVEAIREAVKAARELGIEVLTLYAFSTENWKRPREEVDALMMLLVEYCRREVRELKEQGVRINVIGRWRELPDLQRQAVAEAMADTAHNTKLTVNLALNYGGQAEMVDAFRAIMAKVQAGELQPDEVDASTIEAHLYTAGLPAPDLIIRTAGEFRLSNFLLWQAAYAEFWVTQDRWPDFSRAHLEAALADFSRRERRYGAVLQQSR